MLEADMVLNYNLDWEQHGQTSDYEYCIRNTATHEFGHYVLLWDLLPSHNCSEYERYTMWGRNMGWNTHGKESLECEDKWAVEYMYGSQ